MDNNKFEKDTSEGNMLPKLFVERMKRLLGDEFDDFLSSYNNDRVYSLRLNGLKTKKTDTEMLSVIENGFGNAFSKVEWAKKGYYYENITPGKHPYHEAGVYYIQEASAMLPAELLGVCEGETVLDLCAAPGGKSSQIADNLKGTGILVSNEINAKRALILSENLERLGVKNAIVTNEDSFKLADKFPGSFDKIMVDAPCSGEGMFKKNPIACSEWSEDNVNLCANRQDEILDNAAKMLKPGGRIVYSTCTFAPIENEGSVVRFLNSHPDFKTVSPNLRIPGADCGHIEWVEENDVIKEKEYGLENAIRLWPHRIKGEGHFAVILEKEKPAGPDEVDDYIKNKKSKNNSKKGKNKSGFFLTEKELSDYRKFEKEYLNVNLEGDFIRFGNQLYLIETPVNFTDDLEELLKGLKVFRIGLDLGSFLKNRFEPSHSLALCLKKDEAKNTVETDDITAKKYIEGQSFEYDGAKGWNMVCIDGFSLGWAKCVNATMKNHYPKGLRKLI